MNTKQNLAQRSNKTDAGNGSNGIFSSIGALRSPLLDRVVRLEIDYRPHHEH